MDSQGVDGSDAHPGGPLRQYPTSEFRRWFRVVMETEANMGGVEERGSDWMQTRKEIEWRRGVSYVQGLSRSESNVAHFTEKVNMLLLFNNATQPAFARPVAQFLWNRVPRFLEKLRLYGSDSYHATLLHQLLRMATRNKGGPAKTFRPYHMLGDKPLADGTVEFDLPFERATEERPLCFEHAVVPGILKEFQQKLVTSLKVPQGEPGTRLRLVHLARTGSVTGGRRVLTPDSKRALDEVLNSFDFEVMEVELAGMSFKQQLEVMRNADVVVAVHGAALINAASFCRRDAVIVEIQPYHMFHHLFFSMAVNNGITYLLHQSSQGPRQAGDAEWSTVGVTECMRDVRCKLYFTHLRPLALAHEDFSTVKGLLKLAREIALDARADQEEAGKRLRSRYSELCVARGKNPRCRSTILQAQLAELTYECILQQDCPPKP
eukprot:jgi/Mesen1/8544/ME000484S07931